MVQAQTTRSAHPVMRELTGGVDLFAAAKGAAGSLGQMWSNAEYWLSFELAHFEPLLSKCPSPLRELGVAIALRYSDRFGGELSLAELEAAEGSLLPECEGPLREGLAGGLATLRRAVEARDRVPSLEAEGWRLYAPTAGRSVHALRAMGKALIHVEGAVDRDGKLEGGVGQVLLTSATDDRGRPIAAPEIENRLGAPLLTRDDGERRQYLLLVPGEYVLRVPSKASGDRRLVAT